MFRLKGDCVHVATRKSVQTYPCPGSISMSSYISEGFHICVCAVVKLAYMNVMFVSQNKYLQKPIDHAMRQPVILMLTLCSHIACGID